MKKHRMIVRFALAVFCALGLVGALAPRPAAACSCAVPDPAKYVEGPGVIFGGEVVKTQRIARKHRMPSGKSYRSERLRTTFRVDKVWKGTVGKTAVVVTHPDENLCGWRFRRGATVPFVVAGRARDGTYSTGLCTMLPVTADNLRDRFIAAIKAYAESKKSK